MPETREVLVTVNSKSEKDDGFALELTIPDFRSQFPTWVNRVPPETAERFQPGGSYHVTLEQQNLKKNQNGTMKSGQYPSDYYWGLVPSGEQSPARPASPTSPASTPDRQDLIMLQHASGVVAQAYGDWMRLRNDNPENAGLFSDHLKAIAQGATWYLKNVYQKGGFNPNPTQTTEEPPNIEPDPLSGPAQGIPEDDETPF